MMIEKEKQSAIDQEIKETSHPLVADEWEQIVNRIPVDLEQMAKKTKALQRRRQIKSASDLLRLALGYSVCDWSLRLVGLWGTVIGLGELSDVAVYKRLCHSQAFLEKIIGTMLAQRVGQAPRPAVQIRLIDATTISQPGSRGTDWRVHAKFDLAQCRLCQVEVTDRKGGERLSRYQIAANEINLADRGYAHRAGLGHLWANGTSFVVRTNGHNLPVETAAGQKIDLLAWLQSRPEQGVTEQQVWVTAPQGRFAVRLIARPLPPAEAEKARQRVIKNSRKKGRTPNPLSLVAAGFLLLVTNLPRSLWPAEQVVALYPWRWQIKLLFKRFKSILDLDQLRAKKSPLAQVYLLGKLVGALLLEDTSADLLAEDPSWMADTVRPLSLWRWTQCLAALLRQAVLGPFTLSRFLAVWPRLARYIRDAPRKRPQQAAEARQWLRARNFSLDLFNRIAHFETIPIP